MATYRLRSFIESDTVCFENIQTLAEDCLIDTINYDGPFGYNPKLACPVLAKKLKKIFKTNTDVDFKGLAGEILDDLYTAIINHQIRIKKNKRGIK